MATSLSDIPGANRAPSRRRSERGLWAPSRSTKLDLTPGLAADQPAQRKGSNRPSRQVDLFLVALVLGALGVVAWLGHAFWSATRIDVAVAGIDDGQSLTPEHAADLDIAITFTRPTSCSEATLTVDGVDVMEDLAPKDGRAAR